VQFLLRKIQNFNFLAIFKNAYGKESVMVKRSNGALENNGSSPFFYPSFGVLG
jgi:hypothetical protein